MYSIQNKQLLEIFKKCNKLKSIGIIGIEIRLEQNELNYVQVLKEKGQLGRYDISISATVNEQTI
jgi:hypothetical protein